MRGLILLSIIFPLTIHAFTGVWEMSVKKTEKADFKGLFWNDVDTTVGDGPSPKLTHLDVQAAIQEEFTDPQKAMDQLEKLKGPGGKILFDFGYRDYDRDRVELNGSMEYRCGVIDKDSKVAHMYWELGTGLVSKGAGEYKEYPRHAEEGKFFQLKWASKDQIKRYIAKCFSRLPGMPPLKDKAPQDKPQMFLPDEIYDDFYKWFMTFTGVNLMGPKDPRVVKASQCLLINASANNPDRTGNAIVIQKAKNDEDSPNNGGTFISEIDNLPRYSTVEEARRKNKHTYSMAFMDQSSVQNLRSNWKKGEIQTQGIWPNYQGGSVTSLMAQAFGDQFNVNLKACFLSAGIQMPNLDMILQTIHNPHECRDVDANSLPLEEQMQMNCDDGKGMSCFLLGANYHLGKKFSCLPYSMGGKCNLVDGPIDIKKAQALYTKGCDVGAAEGCYAMGKMLDRNVVGFKIFSKDHLPFYQKGCKLKEVPECFYWDKGMNPVDESNISAFQSECSGNFPQRMSCTSLAFYHQSKGNTQQQMEYLQKGCSASGFKETPNPCVEIANIYVKNGKKKEAIEILKEECSFVNKLGCKELYDLSDKKGKAEVIKKACWPSTSNCLTP